MGQIVAVSERVWNFLCHNERVRAGRDLFQFEPPSMTSLSPEIEKSLRGSAALAALNAAPYSMVLSDPNLPDTPLVYVNRAFEKVTGYTAEMAVGRNCRFLQGDDR